MARSNKRPDEPQNNDADQNGINFDEEVANIVAHAGAVELQLEQTQEKLEEVEDQLMRTAAEYENHRKRSKKEQESAFNNGAAYAVLELLPVLDTLHTAAQVETKDKEYKKGVQLTISQWQEVLEKMDIHEIKALDEPFNPALHNAMMQEEKEGVESGIITKEILKGYTMGDRVIRHSLVAVAP